MVFNVENKKIKIVIPENETYVHITKKCEDYEIIFHDNVESLSIDDDCDFSIEKIKSFDIKNLKNLKLGIMKDYTINGFDKLELLVLPKDYPVYFKPYLKIDNPSLKTVILSPDCFINGRFELTHSIENFFSYKNTGSFVDLKNKKKFIISKPVERKEYFSCVFLSEKLYCEKIYDPYDNCKDELEKTKKELEQLKNKYDELSKEKDDISFKYENLLKTNKNHAQELQNVLEKYNVNNL